MEKILVIIVLLISAMSTEVYAKVDMINIPLQTSIVSLDPSHIQDTSSLFVSRQLNCQLVRSQGSVYKLEAAKSIKYISPLKVMIKISDEAVFHDGTPVTAKDVVASFNYIKKNRNILRNMFVWVDKIIVIDKKTIVFKLIKPIPQFIKILSSSHNAIFKESFLLSAENDNSLWKNPLGCGGYKVSGYDKYKIDLIPIKNGMNIRFHFSSTNQLSPESINQFDISGLSIVGDESKIVKFNKVDVLDPFQIFIGLNENLPAWKNRASRCRFLSKIDTRQLLKAYKDFGRPANDFFPAGTLGYDKDKQYFKNIIASNNEGSPPKKDSFCLSYLTISIPDKYIHEYSKMLQNIYPKVTIKPIADSRQFGKTFTSHHCDALVFGMKSNNLDGYEFLDIFASADANFSGVIDEGIAHEIKNSQNITDPQTRSIEYRKIVSKIEDTCLIRPLLTTPMRSIYVRKNLDTPNIGLGPLNDYYLGQVRKMRS